MVRVRKVESSEDLNKTRKLFREYTSSLGFALEFQKFDKEFADLPGDYSPPEGRLLLAEEEGDVIGCVALRGLTEGICEMKRLYVKPEFRNRGIGRKLAVAVINEAREIGYESMRLDTVPRMEEAIGLYRSLGFKTIDPYRYNPVEGALFFELDLT